MNEKNGDWNNWRYKESIKMNKGRNKSLAERKFGKGIKEGRKERGRRWTLHTRPINWTMSGNNKKRKVWRVKVRKQWVKKGKHDRRWIMDNNIIKNDSVTIRNCCKSRSDETIAKRKGKELRKINGMGRKRNTEWKTNKTDEGMNCVWKEWQRR